MTKLQLTGFSNNAQRVDGAFSPVQLIGNGFASPVAVSLAGFGATIVSVSATELVVVPGSVLVNACADITGPIQITNLNNGDTVTGGTFTFLVAETASGHQLRRAVVRYRRVGGLHPRLQSPDALRRERVGVVWNPNRRCEASSSTSIFVTAPDDAKTAPTCLGSDPPGTPTAVETVDVKVTNRATKCTATAASAFTYMLPCQ